MCDECVRAHGVLLRVGRGDRGSQLPSHHPNVLVTPSQDAPEVAVGCRMGLGQVLGVGMGLLVASPAGKHPFGCRKVKWGEWVPGSGAGAPSCLRERPMGLSPGPHMLSSFDLGNDSDAIRAVC